MLKVINDFKSKIIEICKNNKLFLLEILLAFLMGVVIAIIYLINCKDFLTFKNLIDNTLFLYLKRNIGLFSFFIRKFFTFILFFLLIFFIFMNKFTKYLYLLVTLYLGYSIIFNMGIIILTFGFFGFIFAIIITLILGLAYFALFSIFAIDCNNCLCSNFYLNGFKNDILNFFLITILVLILLIVEIILVSIFSSIFIIAYL